MRTGKATGKGAVFGFICSYYVRRGMPPVIREVQEHFGWRSPRAASYYLQQLLKEGKVLPNEESTSRGVRPHNWRELGKRFEDGVCCWTCAHYLAFQENDPANPCRECAQHLGRVLWKDAEKKEKNHGQG